jgi:hypothetical protein
MKAFWKGFSRGLVSPAQGPDEVGAQPPPPRATTQIIKEPPMEIIGEVKSADEFVRYVEDLEVPSPLPARVFVHHTWRPTREQWAGLQTIMAMKRVYETYLWQDSQGIWHEGWEAGPHLFVADDGIWLFSDLRYDGVGVYGHNYRSRHLEMVGDYDAVRPSGAILENTVVALGILHERFGLDIRQLNFHRDFSSKSCPGWAVEKNWLIPPVEEWIADYRRRKEQELPSLRQSLRRAVQEQLVPMNPHTALSNGAVARGYLGAITNEFPMEINDQGYIVQVFAQALLVPVNQWDKVQTLPEFEGDAKGQPVPPTRQPGQPEEGSVVAPPTDPYEFDGRVR